MTVPPSVPLQNRRGADVPSLERLPGMRSATRRLARLGASDVDLGTCEHGVIARTRAQIGRARKKFESHGAKDPVTAVDALADAIENERRKLRRRR